MPYNFRIMLKWLAIIASVPILLAAIQKPLPVLGKDQQQQAQTKSAENQPSASSVIASEIDKENTENAERYAYYKAHPKEYLKAAFAPANLSNWILAGLGVIGGVIAAITLSTFKRQTDHIITSERAWIVANVKIGHENPIIYRGHGLVPVKADCIFKNKGNTPAFIKESGIAIQVIAKDEILPDSPLPYDPKYGAKWEGRGIAVSPKMSFVQSVFKDTQDPINILNGANILYVYGYVKYRDVFTAKRLFRRKIHETRYCFKYIPAQPQFGMSAQFIIEGGPAYVRAT
jgi:hypothetical protein